MKPFLHVVLDLLVLPLRLAEATNREDLQEIATPFSSLVRIRGGSKASSEHFIHCWVWCEGV